MNQEPSRVPSLCLALLQPDIPQNAGTMLRLCACLGLEAALIEPAAFPLTDRHFRRAGLDYLDQVMMTRHLSWRNFEQWRATNGRRLLLLSTRASQPYQDFAFRPGDIVMVGRESAGAPEEVHRAADARLRVPLRAGARSLNVAVAAAMVLGEALRQIDGFPKGDIFDASGNGTAQT
jgi:tRNA (cytidine/uridine-2'-O-)-methyltransferase